MQAFLIASVNNSFIKAEIKKLSKNLNVSPFNIIVITPQTSIGIEEVRKLTEQIILKPYGGVDRLIIINSIDKATPEASNALLKLLEEPPENTYIILTSENLNKLLPTIISRCQIIIETDKNIKTSRNNEDAIKLLGEILKSSEGERILLSQKAANTREEAIELLSDLLIALEEILHKPEKEISLSPGEIAQLLTKISTAKTYVEKYINFKATLDILFLGFPNLINTD